MCSAQMKPWLLSCMFCRCRELTRTTVQMWRSQVGKRRGRRVKRDASLLKLGASPLAICWPQSRAFPMLRLSSFTEKGLQPPQCLQQERCSCCEVHSISPQGWV